MSVPRWAGTAGGAEVQPATRGSAPALTPTAPRSRAWMMYTLLVVLFAFMGPYSLHPAAATGDDAAIGASSAAAASAVAEGSFTRRIAVVLLAGVGALMLSAARRRRAQQAPLGTYVLPGALAGPLPAVGPSYAVTPGPDALAASPRQGRRLRWLLMAYVTIAAASLLWADDPPLTARRAMVFLIIAFAAYAFAHAWSLRDVLYFSLFANATSLILGIGGALARGDFTPFAADYRYVGFANPNLHGIEAACVIIAAVIALQFTDRRRGILIALIVFAFGMLLLTKSRTALASLLLAGGLGVMLRARRGRLAVVVMGIAAAAFAVVVFAPGILEHVQNAALLGRSAAAEDPATLTGRTLLWDDLLHYFVSARPWFGYGYNSFWSPDHIAEESLRRGWVILQAHSGYLETLLNVGWVGVSLLIIVLFTGLWSAVRRYRATHAAVALFAATMLAWYICNMIAEAIPEAHFSTFVIMILLAHFATRAAAPDDLETAPAHP